MPDRYSISGRSTDTGAAIDDVAANLWNPSSSVPIWVVEVHIFKVGATADNPGLIRTTTAGTTPNNTQTPDIDNHYERLLAPPSGVLLYMGSFATDPTVAGPYLKRANLPAATGAALMWIFSRPIKVPPGTGLAVATPVATILQDSDITFVWEE